MADRASQAERVPQFAFITGVTARGPLGLTALQTAMLARAKKGEPRSTRFLDKRGRFVGACTTPGLRDDLHGYDRMVALAAPALRAVVPAEVAKEPWPIVLAVPEGGRPDDDARFDGAMIQAIAEMGGIGVDERRSRAIRAGHAGMAIALATALDELAKGAPGVLVGAVDSYYHPDVLAWLDEECRLHAMDAENGFVPGEGAAFFALHQKLPKVTRAKDARDAATLALLRRVEVGREETVLTGAPNTAHAMTKVLADLALSAPNGRIPWVLSDLNGERHRGREWMLAAGRGAFADSVVHDRFADDLGDMGAATGGVLGAIACELFRTGAAPEGAACVALASDGPERGAFLLSFEGAAR